MNSDKIGGFLQDLRREQNLTQEELGEKLGTTNKTISRWETGKYLPPVDMIVSMSKLYNVSVNEILSGERLQTVDYQPKAEENIVTTLKKSQVNKRGKDIAVICCAVAVGWILLLIGVYLIINHVFFNNVSAQFANGVYEYTGNPFEIADDIVIEKIELKFKQIDEQAYKDADKVNAVENRANKRKYNLTLTVKTQGGSLSRYYLKYKGGAHVQLYDFDVYEQADCLDCIGHLRLIIDSVSTDEYDVVRNIETVFTFKNSNSSPAQCYLQWRNEALNNRG